VYERKIVKVSVVWSYLGKEREVGESPNAGTGAAAKRRVERIAT
jgi:hypothetical protein